MEKRKNLLLYDILIILFCLILGLSFGVRTILVDTISSEGLAQGISHRMMDSVFSAVGPDDTMLADIQHGIEESAEVKQITGKLLDAMTNGIKEETDFTGVSIYHEIDGLIEDCVEKSKEHIDEKAVLHMEKELQEQKPEIEKVINEYACHTYDNLINGHEIGGKMVKAYMVLISLWFRCIAIILIAVLVFMMYCKSESFPRTVKHLGIENIIVSIIFLAINMAGNEIMLKVTNRFLGRGMMVDKGFFEETIIYFVIGILMFALSFVLNKQKR